MWQMATGDSLISLIYLLPSRGREKVLLGIFTTSTNQQIYGVMAVHFIPTLLLALSLISLSVYRQEFM